MGISLSGTKESFLKLAHQTGVGCFQAGLKEGKGEEKSVSYIGFSLYH